MGTIWAFLLQTLTASEAAVLLLLVKTIFRDKLTPRWQFSAWGVLALVLLVPAGVGRRYALVNWPLLVEFVRTLCTGERTLTQVSAPIPIPPLAVPKTGAAWLFLLYFTGVVVLLWGYGVSYLRLRRALRRGVPASPDRTAQVAALAERYHLTTCPVVEIPGGAVFVCGVLRPVLVLPAGQDVDDKVLLHELLHLRHHDALWGMVTCLFRCIHWCNPLLWYCANRVGNDLESLCDQRVLELLEGEDRRTYGHILLSMANERYARAVGTTSMANGGRNIRRRIEAIARFRRYPAGMGVVSVCVLILLTASLLLGTQTRAVLSAHGPFSQKIDRELSLASARTTCCTTMAGALDAYAKALMTDHASYRAMCAPMEEQDALADRLAQEQRAQADWNDALPAPPVQPQEYAVYNLTPVGKNACEGLLVLRTECPPTLREPGTSDANVMYLAMQTVRAEKEGRRWVVRPQGPFRSQKEDASGLCWGVPTLPCVRYTGTAAEFRTEVRQQRVFSVDNTITEETDMSWLMGPEVRFDLVPKPDARFSEVHYNHWITCTYVGDPAKKSEITQIGVSVYPLDAGETLEEGDLYEVCHVREYTSGSSSTGACWSTRTLERDWDSTPVYLEGGGTSREYDDKKSFAPTDHYAAALCINGKEAARLNLTVQEGGAAQ